MIKVFIIYNLGLLILSPLTFGDSGENSFTPASLTIPIQSIVLDNWNGQGYEGGKINTQYLYQCANVDFSNNCYVDVADKVELQSIVQNTVSINPGTYQRISIDYCPANNDGTYQASIKGSVSINDTTYYTTKDSINIWSTKQKKQDYATITISGCSVSYELASPLVVSPGNVIQLTLFMDVNNIAWAQYQPQILMSSGMGNCLTSQNTNEAICMAYPDVVPYIGNANPMVETYYISENLSNPTQAGGQVILLIDPSTQAVFGGFTRRLYTQVSKAMSFNFDTALQYFFLNTDGTYFLENYGSNGPGFVGYLKFPHFRRTPFGGLNYSEADYTCGSGSNCSIINYRADKQ